MDAIRTYIDNVFAAFPRTEKAGKLKREMLVGMEEKYRELKAEGKSEHEAIGGVIAGFGSAEEIAAELGVEPGAAAAAEDSVLRLSAGEAREYLEQSRRSGAWVGGGVALIIAGLAALVAIADLTGLHGVGVFALLVAIAAAVTIFVVNGNRMEKYEEYEKKDVRLDEQTRSEVEQKRAAVMPYHGAKICVGVAIILLAVGLMVLLGDGMNVNIGIIRIDMGELHDPGLAAFSVGPVWFLLAVAAAVFLFVSSSYQKSAHDVLLGKGDYTRENRKIDRVIGTLAVVYWPLVTAAFLLWSFIGDAWGTSWLIWPVAGIAFGAICGGAGAWHSGRSK